MDENLILTKDQLKTLLLGFGCNKCIGLGIDGSPVENEAAVRSLNSLSQMGLIVSDGKTFHGSEAAKKAAAALGASPRYLAVHTAKAALPDMCCYPSEVMLVCAVFPGDDNRVSMRFTSVPDFCADLSDEGYLPPVSESMAMDEEELEKFERRAFAKFDPNAPLDNGAPVLFSAELISAEGVSLGCLRVVEYYFYRYIFYSRDGKTERAPYDDGAWRSYLKRLMVPTW